MSKGLKVFITYAHKNSEAKDKLITYLAVMKQNGLIDVWHDNEILPGDKWRDKIFNNLADSDILLYLTCPYSLASENCNKELTAALNPNIRVIPIILEHCDWRKNHQLSEFQALPDKGKPINDINEWNPESKGWKSVVDGIRKTVTDMQSQAKSSPTVTPEEIETLEFFLTFHRGNFLLMLKQIDGALKAYSRAIELSPNNAEAYNNRGVTYQEKGELDRAIEDYSKAIQFKPKLAFAYINRGVTYREKGELDRAIEDCSKAIQLKPNYAEAYNNRGVIYQEKGELDRAIEDCSKAIQFKPKLAFAYNNRGVTYDKKGEFDRAINDYNTAIQLKPDSAELYNNRGIVYNEKGEGLTVPSMTITQLYKLKPDSAELYNNRGSNLRHEKGELDRAINDYNTAIQLKPDDAELYNNRGVTYDKKDELDRAINDYNTAIQLKPDDAERT